MFKRKPTLPARPDPPQLEEIHEDIRGAPDNDVIFTMCADRMSAVGRSVDNSDSDFDDSVNNQTGKAVSGNERNTFDKVKTFIDECNRVRETTSKINSLSEELKTSGSKLEEHVVKMRRLLSID